jgi:hypothetical protein
MTKEFGEEFANQVCHDDDDGVVVKLYHPCMSNVSKEIENEFHTKPGYRIWMEEEYEVLTSKEVKELEKFWKDILKD